MTRNCPSATAPPPFIASFFSEETALVPGITAYTGMVSTVAAACISIIDLVDLEKIFAEQQGAHPVANLLSSNEKKILAGFTYPKRRREWLGGRLAAKISVQMLDNPSCSGKEFADLSILPSPNGSPVLSESLTTTNRREPALSISHSHHYAVAMAAMTSSCGVDIQQITDKTLRVADRFCDPDERQLLQDALPEMNEATRMTLLWSAKEALKKSLLTDQPIIFQGVTLLSVKHLHNNISLRLRYPAAASDLADITAVLSEKYILAYTVSPESVTHE